MEAMGVSPLRLAFSKKSDHRSPGTKRRAATREALGLGPVVLPPPAQKAVVAFPLPPLRQAACDELLALSQLLSLPGLELLLHLARDLSVSPFVEHM